METIKVGFIGTGYIGMVHQEMLRRLGGIKIVAVADTNAALVRRAAAFFTSS
jgi:predicted dehydrogenase